MLFHVGITFAFAGPGLHCLRNEMKQQNNNDKRNTDDIKNNDNNRNHGNKHDT